jgi:hypothetical protein
MAITKPSKRSKADAFAAKAPHAKPSGPKLRGKRQPLTFTLPPELIAGIDAVAAAEKRSRANMIEIILGQYLEARQPKEAA